VGQGSSRHSTVWISVKFCPHGRPPPDGGGLLQTTLTCLLPDPQEAVQGVSVSGRLQLPLTCGAEKDLKNHY
jgi:hypothetical protein